MTGLELSAAAITLAAVYLTARQIIWCWPTALVSVTLYALVFHGARLYADMGLQGIYFLLSLYGWWAWLHGGRDHGRLKVATASPRLRLALLLVGAGGGVLLGALLDRFTDASLPYLDSTLSSFSVIGQWLQTRKLIEAWLVWIAVDLFYVGMFLYKSLYPTSALYALFLVLATLGLIDWGRSLKDRSGGSPSQAPA